MIGKDLTARELSHYAAAATEAQNEAKAFSERGLLEAIYILLRRNELLQQNSIRGALSEMKRHPNGA